MIDWAVDYNVAVGKTATVEPDLNGEDGATDAEEVITDAVGTTGVEGNTDDAIEGASDDREEDTGINFNYY